MRTNAVVNSVLRSESQGANQWNSQAASELVANSDDRDMVIIKGEQIKKEYRGQ